jgi:hypothetical protein
MVNFKNLADKAKGIVDKRGGMDSLKEDAEQLKNIAKSKGSFSDKAKEAADALKTPGGSVPASADAPTEPQPIPAERDHAKTEPQPVPNEGGGSQDPEALGSSEPADKPHGEHRGDRDHERHHGDRHGAHRGQGGRSEGGDPKPDA